MRCNVRNELKFSKISRKDLPCTKIGIANWIALLIISIVMNQRKRNEKNFREIVSKIVLNPCPEAHDI